MVSGETARRKHLARRGVEERGELSGRDVAIAIECQRAHAQLRAFSNVVGDHEGCGSSDVNVWSGCRGGGRIVGHGCFRSTGFRRDLHLGKAIVFIDSLEGADIGRDQRLAVDSMTVENAGGVNVEQIHERGGIEVTIAGDGDFLDAAARAELDGIKDVDLIAARRLGFVIDLGIEVAEALKVVAQAAIAFVEQVLVDAAFLKDGDKPLDVLRVHGGAMDFHLDLRPAVGGEAIVDRLGGGIVLR